MLQTLDPTLLAELLAHEPGKAEIINGEIVTMSPTGYVPGYASYKITHSLDDYAEEQGTGHAVPDNVGFLVELPHRHSFSPDAAFFLGDYDGLRFLEGAPLFAVEVRSEGDYGPTAESAMAAKRVDYFAVGTQVVWDVDLVGPDTIRAYYATAPDTPLIFRRGEIAHAEPTLPGWRFPVDKLFARHK